MVIAGVELVLVVKSETHSENCFLAILVFFCSGAGDRFLSSSMIFIKSLVSCVLRIILFRGARKPL